MHKGWQKKKLVEVGLVITGKTPSTKDENNYSSKDYCFVKPGDIMPDKITYINTSENYISDYAFQNTRKLPKGSVLTTCIGIVGKVGILLQEASCNQQINAIIPHENIITSSFLAYSILRLNNVLNHIANAPVVPIINKKAFSDVNINVPPISEQKRIVEELDLLNEILDKKRQQLKELDALSQSIFYDMFGKPVINENSWDKLDFKETVVSTKIGLIRGAKEQSPLKRYLYFKMNNISLNGNVDLSKVTYVDATSEEVCTYKLKYGDFLFNTRNSYELVGKTCVYNIINGEDVIYNNNILRINFNTNVNSIFINFLFQDIYIKRQLDSIKKGTTSVWAIYYKDLANIKILVPPITLQNEFADKIKSIERQKQLIKASIAETQTLLDSRMDYYFN